jgi:hypothetical protein
MVRDGVANVVIRLQESGFDPRKIGPDSWESRCPAHRSADCALSIARNEHNHVVLECRSTQNCQHIRIIGALGFTNDHLYAETPEWLIGRLNRAPIQPASFASTRTTGNNGAGEGASGSAGTLPSDDVVPSAEAVPFLNTAVEPPSPRRGAQREGFLGTGIGG